MPEPLDRFGSAEIGEEANRQDAKNAKEGAGMQRGVPEPLERFGSAVIGEEEANRQDAKNAKENHRGTKGTENRDEERKERYGGRLRGVPEPFDRFGSAEIGEEVAKRKDAKDAKEVGNGERGCRGACSGRSDGSGLA